MLLLACKEMKHTCTKQKDMHTVPEGGERERARERETERKEAKERERERKNERARESESVRVSK
jgi:hypothetical protein